MRSARYNGKRPSVVPKILYLFFVAVLIAAIAYGLRYVWNGCREYQESCTATLLTQAEKTIENQTGLKLSCSPVPTVDGNGDSLFALKNGSKKVGTVKLGVKKKGLLTLALYEIKDIEGQMSYEYRAPEGVEIHAAGKRLEPVSEELFFGTSQLDGFEDRRKSPRIFEYKAEGLFDESQVSVTGTEDASDVLNEKGRPPLFLRRFSEKDDKALKKRAFEIAEKYSRYISTDLAWASLSKDIMAGSSLKTSIPSLENRWYNDHSGVRFDNRKISRPLALNDSYALVNLSYDYVILRGRKENVVPTELAFYLHLDDDGIWRLAMLNTYLHYELPLDPYK